MQIPEGKKGEYVHSCMHIKVFLAQKIWLFLQWASSEPMHMPLPFPTQGRKIFDSHISVCVCVKGLKGRRGGRSTIESGHTCPNKCKLLDSTSGSIQRTHVSTYVRTYMRVRVCPRHDIWVCRLVPLTLVRVLSE